MIFELAVIVVVDRVYCELGRGRAEELLEVVDVVVEGAVRPV